MHIFNLLCHAQTLMSVMELNMHVNMCQHRTWTFCMLPSPPGAWPCHSCLLCFKGLKPAPGLLTGSRWLPFCSFLIDTVHFTPDSLWAILRVRLPQVRIQCLIGETCPCLILRFLGEKWWDKAGEGWECPTWVPDSGGTLSDRGKNPWQLKHHLRSITNEVHWGDAHIKVHSPGEGSDTPIENDLCSSKLV